MDGGLCEIYACKGFPLTINATCTAGTITIYGDATVTDNSGAGCTVNIIRNPVNAEEISGDAVAADNLESQYDTTGLTGDTFPSRQDQLGNLSSGSSGYSINASGVVVTTGSETNSYTDTFSEGVIHIVSAVGGNTDFYYTYDLAAYNGTATEFIWKGYVQTIGDEVEVQYYNWATTSWLTLQTLTGSPGTTLTEIPFDIPVGATGTGANFGEVRMRFLSATTTNIGTDRVRCVFNQSIGGITNGSTITLDSAITNQNFVGSNWNLDLNGQDITGAYVSGAVVEGVSSGSGGTTFEDCYFKTTTLPPGTYVRCGFGRESGIMTAASAGVFTFIDCFSNIAGAGVPQLNFNGLGAATEINNRGWKGGSNYTLDSNCTVSHGVLVGGGQTFTTGGASVELRGIFRSSTFVLSGAGTVQQVGTTGTITISGTATTTVNLYRTSNTVADTSVNTTVNDYTINTTTQAAILADTNETQSLLPATTIAAASDVVTIQNNTHAPLHVNKIMEKPESSLTSFRVELTITDFAGNMQAPDSAPTIDVVNQGGTSRTLNLSATTMALVSVGRYRVTYDVDTSHAIEQLVFSASVVVGGATRQWIGMSQVADDQSTKVDAIHSALLTTHAELSGIPAASGPVLDKLEMLFMAMKNEFTSTSTVQTIKNDAGTPIGTNAVSSVGGTYTKGEFS
jgi:hypothetical protein